MANKTVPTLETIAAAARVSKSTVSRALRGNWDSAETTPSVRRIRNAAKRLGYLKNPVISEVMRHVREARGRSPLGTIGYLTFGTTRSDWREHITYLEFFEGAAARAKELGFDLDEVWAGQPGVTKARLRSILRARGIAGVLLAPSPNPSITPDLDWSELSPVKLGVPYQDLPVSCLHHHHFNGMGQVIEHITELGYRRPGLTLPMHVNLMTGRQWEAQLALFQQGLPVSDRVPPLFLGEPGERVFASWFRRYRPDVIIGIREKACAHLHAIGVRVPEDVGFVHLDRRTEKGDHAGIDQQSATIGAGAVDLVISRLLANERGLPIFRRLVLFDGVWVNGPTVREIKN
jgi:LacI family transcriptional regulator